MDITSTKTVYIVTSQNLLLKDGRVLYAEGDFSTLAGGRLDSDDGKDGWRFKVDTEKPDRAVFQFKESNGTWVTKSMIDASDKEPTSKRQRAI